MDQATDFLAVTPAASYQAPWWLPGGHLQTIYPAVLIPKPAVRYQRERWQTPDNDFIDVDFAMQSRVMEAENPGQAEQPHAPFVLLFHGLEGSSDSHYARALIAGVQQYGWNGAVVHFRGCSGALNLTPRFYHSGDVEEIDWVIRRFKQHALVQDASRLYVVGVSLGGNVLLRWLGESQHQAEIVDGACAVSAPMDLSAGGAALSSGLNLLYTRRFLATLKPKCLQKLDQFPGLFDRERMLNAQDFYEFDTVVTAPLHGYRDAVDYWDRASAKHVLDDISVNTLVLNAQNDPFLPARYLPHSASPSVEFDYPNQGGHVGFATGPFPGRLSWLPDRILRFFNE